MTAKEIAIRHYTAWREMDSTCEAYSFTPKEFELFVDKLCKEQRELCADPNDGNVISISGRGLMYKELGSIKYTKQPEV